MKANEETTISEEQVLFNKLSYEEQQFILKQIRMLQPCKLSCEREEKKIPEKLDDFNLTTYSRDDEDLGLELNYTGVSNTFNDVYFKINEIIDYLYYLKSKGDE